MVGVAVDGGGGGGGGGCAVHVVVEGRPPDGVVAGGGGLRLVGERLRAWKRGGGKGWRIVVVMLLECTTSH